MQEKIDLKRHENGLMGTGRTKKVHAGDIALARCEQHEQRLAQDRHGKKHRPVRRCDQGFLFMQYLRSYLQCLLAEIIMKATAC